MVTIPKRYMAFAPDLDDDLVDIQSHSQILNMFRKKNRRVNNLFRLSDENARDNAPLTVRGLDLLESDSSIDASAVDEEKQDPPAAEKGEQNAQQEASQQAVQEQPRRTTQLHIRNLSPVDIVAGNHEEIKAPITRSPLRALPPAGSNKRNNSLRRSLFTAPPGDAISSTPLVNHLKKGPIFSGYDTGDLSPIGKGSAASSKASSNLKPPAAIPVPSLAGYEPNLKRQYGITEAGPSRHIPGPSRQNSAEPSRPNTAGPSRPNTAGPSRHIPANVDAPGKEGPLVADMEIIEDSISVSQRKRPRSRNQTDVNSLRMVETPIKNSVGVRTPHGSNRVQDSLLKSKLRRCDTTDDNSESDHESNQSKNSKPSSKVSQAATSKAPSRQKKSAKPQVTEDEETGDDQQSNISIPERASSKTPPTRSRSKDGSGEADEDEVPASVGQVEKPRVTRTQGVFAVPKAKGKSRTVREEADVTSDNESSALRSPGNSINNTSRANSSLSRTVPSEVVRSFYTLPSKPPVEVNSQQSDSRAVKVPTKKRKVASTESLSYLKLTSNQNEKRRTKRRSESKRRTLFAHQDEDELEDGDMSPPNPSVQMSREISEADGQVEEEAEAEDDGAVSEPEETMSDKENEDQSLPQRPTKKGKAQKTKATAQTTKATSQAKKTKSHAKKTKAQEKKSDDGSDEGFSSDASKGDNVIYDPYKRGCTRPGLRIRRYAKPYWLQALNTEQIGVKFGTLSNKEIKAQAMLKMKMRKNHITEKQFVPAGLDQWMHPSEKMKYFELQKKEIKQHQKSSKEKSRSRRGAASEKTSSATSSHGATTQSFSSLVRDVCGSSISSSNQLDSLHRDDFDMAAVSRIVFSDCGGGLYFGSYIKKKSDGYIKIMPGGYKPRSRAQQSSLKFLVMQGNIEMTIGDEVVKMCPLTFLILNPTVYYSMHNRSDQEALVFFSRIKGQ